MDACTVGDDNPPIRRMVADFVAHRVAAQVPGLDAHSRFPSGLYREMAGLNLFGVTVPEQYGGAGGRALDYLHVMEALSFGYASIADQCGLVELVSSLLVEHGTADQRERYLKPLLTADRFCAYALTEPQAGSDLRGIATRARRVGPEWQLDGEKVFIHNAPVADFAAVLVRTGDERDAMSVFLVDLDRPGIERTYKERKMGQRASQVGGLRFDSVRLPADALLGEESAGFRYMTGVLGKGRLGIAGLSLGISRAALTAAVDHAEQREAFGRPIGANQAVAFPLADAFLEYRAGLLLAEDAARLVDLGAPQAATACSMAKLYASEACLRHTSTAVQVFGGAGYIEGCVAERLYRDARITTLYEGTSEIQRLIISRSIVDTRRGGTR
ncbi:MAG: acyl-CoA dehydrogenase [Actinobacteria bacterium 13_2_20CM_2_71_6]|nr:MAG: acyl-CoA dehydrogenase [Actinobacteria bacterium 13_2_20CM_2_71_6]